MHVFAAVLRSRILRRSEPQAWSNNQGCEAQLTDTPALQTTLPETPPNLRDDSTEEVEPIRTVYVTCLSPFPEVEAFVDESVTRYNLDLVKVPGPMKEGLEKYLEILSTRRKSKWRNTKPDDVEPNVSAVLVGTRRGDPHGSTLPEAILVTLNSNEFN